MSNMRSNPQFVKTMSGPAQPSGSGFGYLLVSVIALFLIGANAYGFVQATSLPPLIGLTLGIVAFVFRMYMIRRRSPYERVTSDGLERALFYLPAVLISTLLSAFAVYSMVVDSEMSVKRQPDIKKIEHAIEVIETYCHDVRSRISSRLDAIAERLRELENQPPSERKQTESAGLEEDQRKLRALYQRTNLPLRPLAWNAQDDEDSIQEKLSRKFDEVTRLHQELPASISRDVAPPMLESLPEDTISGDKLYGFFRDVLALTNKALGCLAAPIILEIFIVILVISNRPRE